MEGVGGIREGAGKWGEMTQTLYTHMNKIKNFKKRIVMEGVDLAKIKLKCFCKCHNTSPV
jgi:hypothetical protein